MKLLYNETGKTKLTRTEQKALAQLLGYADTRPIKQQLNELQQLRWIRYNTKTGFYTFRSFDKLRGDNGWISRSGFVCYLEDISDIYAVNGAAIYIYLYKSFWRKVRREKVVRKMGRTYQSLPGYFPKKDRFAPVATTGVNDLFNISTAKASRLKHAAKKAGYIEVKKDFKVLPFKLNQLNLVKKYYMDAPNLVIFKDKVCLQLIDLILPNIPLRRRHKLKT